MHIEAAKKRPKPKQATKTKKGRKTADRKQTKKEEQHRGREEQTGRAESREQRADEEERGKERKGGEQGSRRRERFLEIFGYFLTKKKRERGDETDYQSRGGGGKYFGQVWASFVPKKRAAHNEKHNIPGNRDNQQLTN